MSPEQPPKILNDFEKAMRDLLGDHGEDIELLKDIPTIQHALVQHEVRRLDKKLGKDHPRVKNLRSNLARNTDVVRSFSPDFEKDPEEEPEVVSDDSIIMGRLVDEKNIAMVGMTVDIEDESGRKIPNIGGVRTDDAGNFILRIDPLNAEKVKNQVGGTGYLTVRDHKGKVVHQDAAPLRPDKGGQMSMNVSVSTEKFSGKEQVLKPRGAIPRSPLGGIGKGVPGTASLDGKGDDGAARLDGKGDDVTAGMGIKPAEFHETGRDQPAIFSPAPARSAKGERPPQPFGEEKETAKGTIGMGRERMEEDEGEEIVAARGMTGMGGERMEEDEGEEIVASKRRMVGMMSPQGVPPEGPPGPRPEDLAKKPEKHGFLRKGKETSPPEVFPGRVEVEGKKKKMSRKERKRMEK